MRRRSWLWGLRRFFCPRWWRQRKALRILRHARFYLDHTGAGQCSDATLLLIGKSFEVIEQ